MKSGWGRWILLVIPSMVLLVGLGALGYGISDYFKMKPLAKVGMQMQIPKAFQNVQWLGRGPHENYPDRKLSARIGLYFNNVDQLSTLYIRPQENGNRTDVRWMEVGSTNKGIKVFGEEAFNFSVHNYTLENLTYALHTIDIKDADFVTLNIDHKTSGLGGCSFKYNYQDKYLLKARSYSYEFTIEPTL